MNEPLLCYVCEKPIRNKDDAKYIGQEKWRHDTCHPGSEKWLNSKTGKESKYSGFLKLRDKKSQEEKPEKPPKVTIKDKINKMFT